MTRNPDSLNTIRVSVVVPTYKRPELLERCLVALLAQKFDPSAFEIIVVDDEPGEETRRVVESWRARVVRPSLRYLSVSDAHGPAAARNVGWRAAHGDIIAFTDDDCLPMPDWLAAGVRAILDEVEVVSGRVIVPLPRDPTDYERTVSWLERCEFLTASCFCRRETLAELGGFDERFTSAYREDTDLYFAFLENGKRMACAPEAIVYHPIRPMPWGISLSQQRKNVFNALLYKKHPRLYRQRIQRRPPWRYYVITGALLMAIGGLLAGTDWLGIASATLWGGLTGGFCLERLQHTSRTLSHVAEMIVTSAVIPPLAVFWRLCGALKYRVLFL